MGSKKGHNELVEVLIKAGADINTTSKQKMTALNYAINANNLDAIKLLIEKGADPNTVVNKETGQTLLMRAAENGRNDLVEALIEAGADINTTSKQKMTALNYAINANNDEIIRLLLNASDINISAQDNNGYSALRFAVRQEE